MDQEEFLLNLQQIKILTQEGVDYIEQKGEIDIKEIQPVQISEVNFEDAGQGEGIFTFNID